MATALSRQILAEHLRNPPTPPEAMVASPAYIVISIKPDYARSIQDGSKRVEFRRRFPRHFKAGQAIFYLSSPVRAIALVARIAAVRRASPGALWREFGAIGGVARGEFHAYFEGVDSGVSLQLDQVRALSRPIPLSDPRLCAMGFKPPQSLAVLPLDSLLPALVSESG